MRNNENLKNAKNIHFVGIGGVSMSGLAKYCYDVGFNVSGSDLRSVFLDTGLKNRGVEVWSPHCADKLDNVDLVVYTSAINKSNEELLKAERLGVHVMKRSELLSSVMDEYKYSVAVSGSHGKTTSTAMISEILLEANKEPTVFLGGDSVRFGNYIYGKSEYVVAETCEYQKNLLDISAKYSVILNIDDDHLDTYKNMKEMVDTFKTFAGNSYLIVNADDKYASEVFNSSTVTFGIDKKATYTAYNVAFNGRGYTFSVKAYGIPMGKINLNVLGRHNVYNALSAIAVADALKIPFSTIKRALEQFAGVKRRNELLGEKRGCLFYADYAHHPEEINAMLDSYKSIYGKFAVVFQPHTYSRTRLLFEKFISVLSECESLLIYKTYAAREDFDYSGDGERLYESIKEESKVCCYAENENELKKFILENADKKCILFLGAGDIYDVARNTINKLI